jgi:hypothetical protein
VVGHPAVEQKTPSPGERSFFLVVFVTAEKDAFERNLGFLPLCTKLKQMAENESFQTRRLLT